MPQDLDKLLATVGQQAAQDQAEVLMATQEKVFQIEADAARRCQAIEAEIEAQVTKSLAQETERLAGQSQVALRIARQQAQSDLMGQVFAQARQALAQLSSSKSYGDILGGLIREALDLVGSDARIEVAKSELKLCQSWCKAQSLELSLTGIKAEPGTVWAIASDGKRRIDNSLLTRLDRLESLQPQVVAETLFGKAKS